MPRDYATPAECLSNHAKSCDDWIPSDRERELVDMCHGHFYRDGADSYAHIFVFDGEVSDDEAFEIVQLMGFSPYEQHCRHEYDCCGCWFGPNMRMYPSDGTHRIGVIGRHQNV